MFDDIWPEHGNFFGESSAGTREITWSFPRPLQLELLAIAPDMPQMTKAKRFGDHGDPRCVYVYIYIYVIIFIHYIILYIYTTGNIYIYRWSLKGPSWLKLVEKLVLYLVLRARKVDKQVELRVLYVHFPWCPVENPAERIAAKHCKTVLSDDVFMTNKNLASC